MSGPGALEPAPEAIYDGIRWPSPPPDRPYVALNMVMTADGKTTLDGGRHERAIGSPVDRALMVRLRTCVDAVVRGAGTVRRSPYYPHVVPGARERRKAAGVAEVPLFVIISGSGELPLDTPLFREPPRRPLVFVGPAARPDTVERLRQVAQVRAGPVDVPGVLRCLAGEFGVRILLSEGGPTLNAAFFEAGCVDELFLTVAPFVAGSARDLSVVEGERLLQPFPELELLSVNWHASELYLRYRVLRGGPERGG
ncbi:MAG: dihydrofolate reductase family protein [Bacillota bacterium]